MKLLALCITLSGSFALAQGKPTLIDHPLDVKIAISDAQQSALQDDFRQLLARNTKILVPTRSNWKVAVAALKRQDCDIRNECLRQLATTGGTLYALYASLERNAASTEVTATGRVVNQDGVQVRPPASATAPKKGTFEDAAREALAQLLTKLELEKLSPVLTAAPVEVKTPEAAEVRKPDPGFGPPPPPPPNEPMKVNDLPQVEASMSGGRKAGMVFAGLAVVAGAVSIGFGASAAVARAGLPKDGLFVDQNQVAAQKSVNQGAMIALASGIAAGVLGVVGISLIAASPSQSTSLSLAPIPGGAAVAFGGQF